MPIRPENADRYPKDWPAIRERIQQRAGNRCELCGLPNHALGGRLRDGTFLHAQPLSQRGWFTVWPKPGEVALCGTGDQAQRLRIIRIVCTTAHWYDDRPEACEDENLKFACQRWHLAHDRQMHTQNRYENARKDRAIGDLFGDPSPAERDAFRARMRRKAANPPEQAG